MPETTITCDKCRGSGRVLRQEVPDTGEGNRARLLAVRADLYIRENFDKRIRLGLIAQALSVSREHLSRLFKKYWGVTITRRIHQVRIEAAEEIILEGRVLKMRDVAEESGYSNYSDFFRNFRRLRGTSPSVFSQNPSASAGTERTNP